jgi:ATP-binding cassette subfamily B protein
LQQAYSAWSSINGRKASLMDVLDLLDQALPEYANAPPAIPLPFENSIVFDQLSFRYNLQTQYVLQDINLTISKGSRIGFIGTTGSGKSTLLDMVMGLLQPTDGVLQVDGVAITSANNRAWQAHIAHVPQAIFLADGTIEENIAFGVPPEQICPERVRQAAEQAQIARSIEGWPNQYRTLVGERGVRLSGGQRQRIGIARALYKRADVIVFDEATSALDSETEHAVMHAIESLSKDLTLLIIAHRISTLKNCTQIVELSEGLVKQVCSYHQIALDKKAA